MALQGIITVFQWLFVITLLAQIPEETRFIGRIVMIGTIGVMFLLVAIA
jgi:hypothetical protein